MTQAQTRVITLAPMPGAYSNVLLHIITATKNREPHITADLQPRLYDYLGGVVRGEGGTLYAIGGIEDHVHLLIRWRVDMTIADLLRKAKGGSSLWVHNTFPDHRAFKWQEGYSVFSVSQSIADKVKHYIQTQTEHHRVRTFQDELVELLHLHNVEYDPKYLLA